MGMRYNTSASVRIIIEGRIMETLLDCFTEHTSKSISQHIHESDVSEAIKNKVTVRVIAGFCGTLARKGIVDKKRKGNIHVWKRKSAGTIGRF